MIDLPALTGSWRGSLKTWLDPDAAPLASDISGTFSLAPGGVSVMHDYTSAVGEKLSNGSMVIGRSLSTGRYNLIWIDSYHTGGGVMFFDSEDDETFLGSYAAGSETWRWRIRFTLAAAGALKIEHANIAPDGAEVHAIEVQYSKA